MITIQRALLVLLGITLPIEGLGTFSIAGYPVGLNKAATGALLFFAFATWPMTRRPLRFERRGTLSVALRPWPAACPSRLPAARRPTGRHRQLRGGR